MIRMAPSSVSRRPASARSRFLTGSDSAMLPAMSNRSCTAEETLLTFCPPGPDAFTKAYVRSLSGIETLGVISRAMTKSAALLGVIVEVHGLRLNTRRSSRDSHWRRLLQHPQLSLRDRYLHAVRPEDLPDGAVDVRAHVVHA